jgi:hypothetical protein
VISPSPRPRSPLRRVRGRGAGSGQRWRHAPPPGRPPCLTCAPPLHPAPRPARPTARASLTPAPTAGCGRTQELGGGRPGGRGHRTGRAEGVGWGARPPPRFPVSHFPRLRSPTSRALPFFRPRVDDSSLAEPRGEGGDGARALSPREILRHPLPPVHFGARLGSRCSLPYPAILLPALPLRLVPRRLGLDCSRVPSSVSSSSSPPRSVRSARLPRS